VRIGFAGVGFILDPEKIVLIRPKHLATPFQFGDDLLVRQAYALVGI